MKISLTFVMYATFDDGESCNPDELLDIVKWMEFEAIGYEIYKNRNFITKGKEFETREIQIFCKMGMDGDETHEIYNKLCRLRLPYVETVGKEIEKPIEKHWEPVILENRKIVLEKKKVTHSQQTQIQYYQNEQHDSKVPTTIGENKQDAERIRKGIKKD